MERLTDEQVAALVCVHGLQGDDDPAPLTLRDTLRGDRVTPHMVESLAAEVQQARRTMTAQQYDAAVEAYWNDDAAAVGDCDGCAYTGVVRRPICRSDGVVWMICDRCLTHDHLRNCRVCHVRLPVATTQAVDKAGGWNYCPEHAAASK